MDSNAGKTNLPFGTESSKAKHLVDSEETVVTKPKYRIIHPSKRLTMTHEEFMKETTEEERTTLLYELNLVINSQLSLDKAIYLERLGFIYPITRTSQANYPQRTWCVIREETHRTAAFEKCEDIVTYHRDKYSEIVETSDLVKKIYLKLPLNYQIRWSESDVKRRILALLRQIKREIVHDGYSGSLSAVGEFYALHNRQGQSEVDWFAGADILLVPQFRELVSVGTPNTFERPVLQNPFELLDAIHGKCIKSFSVDVKSILEKLGYELDDEAKLDDKIKVNVYGIESNRSDEMALLYCTDGIRHLARSETGTELTFHLALPSSTKLQKIQDEVPTWPLKALTLGWLLVQSTQSRRLKPAQGFSCEAMLSDQQGSLINSIFTSEYRLIPGVQLTEDRPFRYINLVGITAAEANVADKFSPNHLLRLLECRSLDQITRPSRTSVVNRSVWGTAAEKSTTSLNSSRDC